MAEQHVYDIWLQSVLSVKCPQVTEIAAYFGSAQHIYEADEMELKICGLFSRTEFRRIALRDLKPAESIYQRCLECGIDVLSFFDSAYPESLRNIPSPPLVLYIKGKMPDLDRMKLAMVGTRTPSLLGKQIAYEFGFQLTRNKALIISGGAEGIDTEAHRGALLAGGSTICVLGCGINSSFPKAGQRLRQEVTKRGALISEYPPDAGATNYSYPDRNRLISGLSDAVMVVEAGPKSGSLITASYAALHRRPLFAVPGNIDNRNSFGTNGLIAMGAGLVYRYEMLLDWYNTNKRSADDLGQTFTYDIVNDFRAIDFTSPMPYVHGIGMLYPLQNKTAKPSKRQSDETDKKVTAQAKAPLTEADGESKEIGVHTAENVTDHKKISTEQLTETMKTVYDTISETPISVSEIITLVRMNASEVMSTLTELELSGLISLSSFGRYIRK